MSSFVPSLGPRSIDVANFQSVFYRPAITKTILGFNTVKATINYFKFLTDIAHMSIDCIVSH